MTYGLIAAVTAAACVLMCVATLCVGLIRTVWTTPKVTESKGMVTDEQWLADWIRRITESAKPKPGMPTAERSTAMRMDGMTH